MRACAWGRHSVCALQHKVQLTDGLCCTCSCSSHSHHILSSHWHTVIAWGRIWGWLKGVTTPPSCALGNVHILSSHNRPSLDTHLVLCDVPPWPSACLACIQWVLEEEIQSHQSINKMCVLKDAGERNIHLICCNERITWWVSTSHLSEF